MSRGTQVKYEDVAQACAELFRAGESVSFAKVYQRIGSRGGQQVVTDMIRRWRQDIAQRVLAEREHPQLPPGLVQASDGLVAALWQQALGSAQQGYQQQVEALAQREAEWQRKLDASQVYVVQVDRENLEIKAQLAHVQGQLQALQAAHQDLSQQNHGLQDQLTQAEKALVLAQEQVVQLQAAMASEQLRHAQALEALKVRHAHDVRQVRVRADEDRRHLLQQTDELRQAHRAQAEQWREQHQGAVATLEAVRQQLGAAREEGARWQGRSQALQQEIGEVKAQGVKSQEEAARWQARALTLQEVLQASKSKVEDSDSKSESEPTVAAVKEAERQSPKGWPYEINGGSRV